MLNPAGDAKTTGRTIDAVFERSITLKLCEQLKESIEATFPQIAVVLTRSTREIVQPLQHAHYANCLPADLYISIHCIQETDPKPNIYLYQFCYGNDFFPPSCHALIFYPYDQADLPAKKVTTTLCTYLRQELIRYESSFTVHDIYKLPFKPLIGIACPACGIELGIKKANDWHMYVEPLCKTVGALIERTHS